MTTRSGTVLADAGYWHTEQMQNIVVGGSQVLISPDSDLREGHGRDGRAGSLTRRVLASEHGREIYRQRKQTIEPGGVGF